MADRDENAAQPDAKQTENKDAAPANKSKAAQFLLAMLLVLGLMAGSAGAAVMVASIVIKPPSPTAEEKAAEETAKAAAHKKKTCEFAIDNQLIVNVYQTQQRRYLSVKPVFVCESEEVSLKLKEKMVEVQHMLIGILKTKTLEQLDDPDITNILGREIQETVNLKLDLKNGIISVHFTQFVVQ